MKVIVLSDDGSTPESSKTPHIRKGTKRWYQKRPGVGRDAGPDNSSCSLPKVVPAEKPKARLSTTSQTGSGCTRDETVAAGKDVQTGRARRAAATTASKKLANAFPSSVDPGFSAKDADSSPAARVYKSKIIKAKGTEAGKSSRRAPSPVADATRSSSPTSKVSKMKAKNAAPKSKPVKTGQKRMADKAAVVDEEMPSRKKPKVDSKVEETGQESAHSVKNPVVQVRKDRRAHV